MIIACVCVIVICTRKHLKIYLHTCSRKENVYTHAYIYCPSPKDSTNPPETTRT
uniref:Uncharacterized protein n=1 Tax=Octopus bimaculoides TaxID=37653 RepID=A0A0L8HB87_OCTBM